LAAYPSSCALLTSSQKARRRGTSREEIEFLIAGVTRGHIPDYQIAAWLMAVVWRGMSSAELAALTEAMLHSGVVLDWPDLPAAKVDKHSTGV